MNFTIALAISTTRVAKGVHADISLALTHSSTVFFDGGAIPETYVQARQNKSPPLRWRGAPKGPKDFVRALEDHDTPVGIVTHWVVYDIPADSDGLLEGLGSDQVPRNCQADSFHGDN